MKQRVTISDVAKAAGVSKQTVSRAINDKGEINPETKARIMEIVAQLDYRPSRLARGMTTQRTHSVGIVVPNITNPFFPDIIRGIQDLALQNDYNVYLCNSDDSQQIEMRMLRLLTAQEVDGLILYAPDLSETDLRQFLDTFARPVVLLNRDFSHANTSIVSINTYQGAQLVVDYLVSQKHTNIALLMPDVDTIEDLQRVQGFIEQLQVHGQTLPKDKIFTAKPDLNGGYQSTQELFDHHPDTTAIFSYNDLMAIGAMRACKERNLQVPQDVAVIGFDDIPFAVMASPSLTTIRVDKYEVGQTAMRRLFDMLENENSHFDPIMLDVTLVTRESA